MGACALPGPAAPGSGKEPHSYGNFCLRTGERWRPLQLRPEEEGNRPGPHRPLLASQPRQALPGLSAQGKRPSRFTLMCWFHMTKATYLFEPNFSVCVARGADAPAACALSRGPGRSPPHLHPPWKEASAWGHGW